MAATKFCSPRPQSCLQRSAQAGRRNARQGLSVAAVAGAHQVSPQTQVESLRPFEQAHAAAGFEPGKAGRYLGVAVLGQGFTLSLPAQA